MKKKMTDSGNELHMDRGGTSTNSETQHVLPISGSGLATTKEAPAFHGLSVEAERDMIKTTTSKVKTVERVAGSIIMEPLSVVSSFSEKMNSLTNEATGLNAGAVIDQIADAKKQLDKDMSRIKITLNPPNLGTVELEVTVRQNRVEVVMITDHSGVQQILQSHAEDMKSAMQRQDMKIDSYQVFLQNNTDGNQQQTNQWTAMHDQSGEKHLQHFSEEDAPDTRFVSGDRSVQGSSGLVSIFA